MQTCFLEDMSAVASLWQYGICSKRESFSWSATGIMCAKSEEDTAWLVYCGAMSFLTGLEHNITTLQV